MLKKVIYSVLRHRHFWRDVGFDELSELYIGMLFRSLALGLIGVFVPVYLLKNGYDLQSIILFFLCFFAARTIMDIVSGYTVARIGPKHTMVISYISQIVASSLFLTLPEVSWPLFLPAFFWGAANSLFFVAFHVDFSKIKHTKHGGKELSYMHIMERIGGATGPLLGGLLATLVNPQFIFLLAICLLFTGLIPLFRTAEPVKVRQKLNFKDLPLKKIKRDLASYTALMIESNLCLITWPLFLSLFVFTGSNVYAQLGVLTTVSISTSILAARLVGKLADKHQGRKLIRVGTIINSLVYIARPFTKGFFSATAIGVANEAITVSYRIPYQKGMYDAADDLPGFRIAYHVTMESMASFAKALIWCELYLLSAILSGRQVLHVSFAIAAVASLFVMTEKYRALEYHKSR